MLCSPYLVAQNKPCLCQDISSHYYSVALQLNLRGGDMSRKQVSRNISEIISVLEVKYSAVTY